MTSEIAVFVKNDLHTDDPDAWVGTTQSRFSGAVLLVLIHLAELLLVCCLRQVRSLEATLWPP